MSSPRLNALIALPAALAVVATLTGCGDVDPSPEPVAAAAMRSAAREPVVTPDETPAPVVTPDGARQVIATLWSRREPARLANDDATLQQLAAGVALESELGASVAIRCGCERPKGAHRLIRTTVLVPRRTSFPASFLARLDTVASDGRKVAYLAVVARVSRAEDWRIAVLTVDYASRDTVGRIGAEGFNAAPHAPGPQPGAVHAQLAAYYQGWWDGGRAPRPARFAPGFDSSNVGREAFAVGPVASWGGRFAWTYRADPTPPFRFALRRGRTLECGAVRATQRASIPGGTLRQDPAGRNWGAWLTEGSYERIDMVELWQSCVIVADEPGAPLVVVGKYGGKVGVTGLPVDGAGAEA